MPITPPVPLALVYVGGYLFQCVTSLTVYSAARALERRGSRWLVQTGGALALVMGVLAVLMATPVFFALPGALESVRGQRDHADVLVVTAAVLADVAALPVSFLVAGIKALLVMNRPAVYDAFRR